MAIIKNPLTIFKGGEEPILIEKTITENGEYLASSDNADGFSKVTVDVEGSGGNFLGDSEIASRVSIINGKGYETRTNTVLGKYCIINGQDYMASSASKPYALDGKTTSIFDLETKQIVHSFTYNETGVLFGGNNLQTLSFDNGNKTLVYHTNSFNSSQYPCLIFWVYDHITGQFSYTEGIDNVPFKDGISSLRLELSGNGWCVFRAVGSSSAYGRYVLYDYETKEYTYLMTNSMGSNASRYHRSNEQYDIYFWYVGNTAYISTSKLLLVSKETGKASVRDVATRPNMTGTAYYVGDGAKYAVLPQGTSSASYQGYAYDIDNNTYISMGTRVYSPYAVQIFGDRIIVTSQHTNASWSTSNGVSSLGSLGITPSSVIKAISTETDAYISYMYSNSCHVAKYNHATNQYEDFVLPNGGSTQKSIVLSPNEKDVLIFSTSSANYCWMYDYDQNLIVEYGSVSYSGITVTTGFSLVQYSSEIYTFSTLVLYYDGQYFIGKRLNYSSSTNFAFNVWQTNEGDIILAKAHNYEDYVSPLSFDDATSNVYLSNAFVLNENTTFVCFNDLTNSKGYIFKLVKGQLAVQSLVVSISNAFYPSSFTLIDLVNDVGTYNVAIQGNYYGFTYVVHPEESITYYTTYFSSGPMYFYNASTDVWHYVHDRGVSTNWGHLFPNGTSNYFLCTTNSTGSKAYVYDFDTDTLIDTTYQPAQIKLVRKASNEHVIIRTNTQIIDYNILSQTGSVVATTTSNANTNNFIIGYDSWIYISTYQAGYTYNALTGIFTNRGTTYVKSNSSQTIKCMIEDDYISVVWKGTAQPYGFLVNYKTDTILVAIDVRDAVLIKVNSTVYYAQLYNSSSFAKMRISSISNSTLVSVYEVPHVITDTGTAHMSLSYYTNYENTKHYFVQGVNYNTYHFICCLEDEEVLNVYYVGTVGKNNILAKLIYNVDIDNQTITIYDTDKNKSAVISIDGYGIDWWTLRNNLNNAFGDYNAKTGYETTTQDLCYVLSSSSRCSTNSKTVVIYLGETQNA